MSSKTGMIEPERYRIIKQKRKKKQKTKVTLSCPGKLALFYDTISHLTLLLQSFLSDARLFCLARTCHYMHQKFLKYPFSLRKMIYIDKLIGLHYYQKIKVYKVENVQLNVAFPKTFKTNRCEKIFPEGVKDLRICVRLGEKIRLLNNMLPSTLTNIEFHSSVEIDVDLVWPKNVQKLVLGYNYHIPIPQNLPSSLTSICIKSNNQRLRLTCLSPLSNLQSLVFDSYTISSISEMVIPSSLTEMSFPLKYNEPLWPHIFPPSLTKLTFGSNFNQPIIDKDILPIHLRYLEFGYYFHQSDVKIDHLLELETIRFQGPYEFKFECPPNLTELIFECVSKAVYSSTLPVSLQKLTFSSSGFHENTFSNLVNLKEVTWNYNENIGIYLPNSFADSLMVLKFPYQFNYPISKGMLPPNLEYLSFTKGGEFNQHLPVGVFPKSLRFLELGNSFNQKIKLNVLNHTQLVYLHFGHKFRGILRGNCLPSKLQFLILSPKYRHSFYDKKWPQSLVFVGHSNTYISVIRDSYHYYMSHYNYNNQQLQRETIEMDCTQNNFTEENEYYNSENETSEISDDEDD